MSGRTWMKRGLLAAVFMAAFAFTTVGSVSDAEAGRCRGYRHGGWGHHHHYGGWNRYSAYYGSPRHHHYGGGWGYGWGGYYPPYHPGGFSLRIGY